MIRCTLHNLENCATRTSDAPRTYHAGALPPDTVITLLDQFSRLDALENAKSEPEIVLETRRFKFVVRTGQGRLHLYDPRNPLEPAVVLTAAEVVAELDGTADAARSASLSRPPIPIAEPPEAEIMYVPKPPAALAVLRLWHRLAFASVAFVCLAYLGYPLVNADRAPTSNVGMEPITDEAEITRHRGELAGVYMAGSQPGDHGIALSADGNLLLFQLNSNSPPSRLQDTFRFGQVGHTLCVLGSQPETVIQVSGKLRLTFAGESYERLQ